MTAAPHPVLAALTREIKADIALIRRRQKALGVCSTAIAALGDLDFVPRISMTPGGLMRFEVDLTGCALVETESGPPAPQVDAPPLSEVRPVLCENPDAGSLPHSPPAAVSVAVAGAAAAQHRLPKIVPQKLRTGKWTRSEDKALISAIAARIVEGVETANAAIPLVINDLAFAGRTIGSVKIRTYRMKDFNARLDAAVAGLRGADVGNPDRDPDPVPVAPPAPRSTPAPIPRPAVAAAPVTTISPRPEAIRMDIDGLTSAARTAAVRAYLAALPVDEFWTPTRDMALCEGLWAGMDATTAAAKLGVPSVDLVDRFHVITAQFRDPRGRVCLDAQCVILPLLRDRVRAGGVAA